MPNPAPRRLRASSDFTCSRCGGHEAYNAKIQSPLGRLVSKAAMVRPILCCDCDALCIVFPARQSSPIAADLSKSEIKTETKAEIKTAPLLQPDRKPAAKPVPDFAGYGGAAAHFYRSQVQRSTGMLPTPSH